MMAALALAFREGLGAVLAAPLSLGAGVGLYALGISLEGLAMLLAVGVLTWMIFGMEKQGRQIRAGLERDVRRAATVGGRGKSSLLERLSPSST